MPRRTDIKSILIIGSGPIVIGQGCEFDYSGVQACRALREEGYRIVLINSNPATIMTDPEFADATYIEPITPETIDKILTLEAARGTPVDALLPTLGGQTGLNVGMACFDSGVLAKHKVQMIGADREAIYKGEDRQVFKDLMISIGLKVPRSGVVHNMEEARVVLADIGLPLIIRPAFTLGGTGGGIAYNVEEFEDIVQRGIDASPVNEILIEQSVIGWKEYEMEVVRDKNDNCIIICSIENIDAMGVHTGDSITVAPIQTLSDKEYQKMRDASIAVIRAVGVETGGSNIQFGIDPANGDMVVIEMNPRVSRSSALASKATGYPIAKIAAKLAVGYTLDELPNPITTRKKKPIDAPSEERGEDARGGDFSRHLQDASTSNHPDGTSHHAREDYDLYTSACFEPSIDYCVIKIPRWTFEKFPDADETLTTQMKSVGEAMAIGRTFKEALQKGIRSLEVKRFGFGLDANDQWLKAQRQSTDTHGTTGNPRGGGVSPPHEATRGQDARATGVADVPSVTVTTPAPTAQGESAAPEWPIPDDKLTRKLAVPSQGRLYYVRYALKMNWSVERIHELTHIDPWFLAQMRELTDFEASIASTKQFIESKKTNVAGLVDALSKAGDELPEYYEAISRLVFPAAKAKSFGYSDVQLAAALNSTPSDIRSFRALNGIMPVYKLVDTCAAEFEAATPYYYSTYETPFTQSAVGGQQSAAGVSESSSPPTADGRPPTASEDEIRLTDRPKVIIIGGGPNRIGQGIEFDYCCVHAAFAMKELGFESVMINSNPETVSTDYDTSDLLFFEPLTHEDVLNVCERLNGGPFKVGGQQSAVGSENAEVGSTHDQPRASSERLPTADRRPPTADPTSNLVHGVIVQYGGQTPLNLAKGLAAAGVPILGTTVASLDAAGDREQFRDLLQSLGLKQPRNGIAKSIDDARRIAREIGYPVLVRPSFVLGGRAMEIVSDEAQLNHYMATAVEAAGKDNPILVDKFLDHATEVDVDCVADYSPHDEPRATSERLPRSVICGVMEHIEEAGIHSGDSACALPPYSLSQDVIDRLKQQTHQLAKALRVRGLMNVQYAIKDNEIYVIEVNPRASRTIPFVSKATGISWAKIAAKVMAGRSLDELGVTEPAPPKHVSVKEVVFPFSKFPGVDVILGPEMRSTGEVMGIDATFNLAFAKSQIAAGQALPLKGKVFVSVNDRDKAEIVPAVKQLVDCGLEIIATGGTFDTLKKAGVTVSRIAKLAEGRPNIRDLIKNGQVQLIINTPTKKGPTTDEGKIRAMAVLHKVPMITTATAAKAAAGAIAALKQSGWGVKPLQDYHA